MPIQIEDILAIACSSVKLTLNNDFQRVYQLTTASEARLAFDVLVAHGFDVKVYHQDDNSSKLYITHPAMPPAQLEEILINAKAYVTTLKQIKQNLDQLAGQPLKDGPLDYNMTFANIQPSGKQIIVQITSQNAPGVVSVAAPASAAASASAPAAQMANRKKYMASKHAQDEFSSGPAVGRAKYPGSAPADGTVPEETLKRRIMLTLFGNMATSSYAMLIMAVIVAAIFSMFVFAKAFLCPDFASMKRSSAWYCQNNDVDDKDREKQQRQKQIGLAPADNR